MEKQLKQTNVLGGGGTGYPLFREKDWYMEKIIEMSNRINDEKILKRIYISLRDYVKEN